MSMLSKSHPVILFMDRFGFSLYQDTLSNISKFNFTSDLVVNLDVVNKERFSSLIATFIQINKIIPSSLAVILSDDAVYVQDFANPVQKSIPTQNVKLNLDKDNKNKIQNFLEDVPFENVLAKVIKTGKADRVIATNKDLVMTIVDVFMSKGFIVEIIAPSFLYGQSVNFTSGLTPDNIRAIFGNIEILRSGNLLTDQEKIISSQDLKRDVKDPLVGEVKKPQNFRQYILIGVFIVMLAILAVVYFNLGISQVSPQKPEVKSIPVNAPSIAPTVFPASDSASTQTLVPAVPVDIGSIKIKIIQGSQVDERAVNLRNELLKIGFQDVVIDASEISIPEKSSIVFSQNIPIDLSNYVIEEVKKILPETSILQGKDSNFMIKILIGKS